MANYDNPNGFRPYSAACPRGFVTLGGTVAEFDPIGLTAGGAGELYSAGSHPAGIFGVAAESGVSGDVIEVYLVSPNEMFLAQFDGTLAQAVYADRYDISGATGATQIGSQSDIGAVQVMRHYSEPGSTEVAANARVVCRFILSAAVAMPVTTVTLANVATALGITAAVAITATNVGAGAAGKTIKLDGDGKLGGRVVETDGTALDGIAAERVINIEVNHTAFSSQAGTWAASAASGAPALVRTAGAGGSDAAWMHAPVNHRSTSGRGFKCTGLKVQYAIGVAALDDILFQVMERTIPATGSAIATAILGGNVDGEYDAAHNTAVERGATGNHTAVVTLATPAYLAADEQLAVKVLVDGDAGGAATLAIMAVEMLGLELVTG